MNRIAALLVVGLMALAGCGDDGSADPTRSRRAAERDVLRAREERNAAEARARATESSADRLRRETAIRARATAGLDAELAEAQRALAAATSAEERARIERVINTLRQRLHVVELEAGTRDSSQWVK